METGSHINFGLKISLLKPHLLHDLLFGKAYGFRCHDPFFFHIIQPVYHGNALPDKFTHRLNSAHRPRCSSQIINAATSAGETPEIRDACPRLAGRTSESFSRASSRRP